jgi:nitrate/nitrite-specific signal transduction histidine kinase
VRCRVDAPSAEIVVSDDGAGLGPRRHDSHGIEIMHERARLIDADLTITDGAPGGTVVVVRLPGASSPRGEDAATDKRVRA